MIFVRNILSYNIKIQRDSQVRLTITSMRELCLDPFNRWNRWLILTCGRPHQQLSSFSEQSFNSYSYCFVKDTKLLAKIVILTKL